MIAYRISCSDTWNRNFF